MKGTAVAYDMFGTDYSDAHDAIRFDNLAPKGDAKGEDSTPSLDANHQVYVLPVKEFRNSEYSFLLRSAIPVLLEREDKQYIALNENSRICGEGEDAPSALRDFGNAFISVYLSYRDSEDRLSPGAKEFLELLNGLIASIEKI